MILSTIIHRKITLVFLLTSMTLITNAQFEKPLKKGITILDGKVLPKDFNYDRLNADSIQAVQIFKVDSVTKLTEFAKKYGVETKNGVVVITTRRYERLKNIIRTPDLATKSSVNDEPVLQIVETFPQFPDGQRALYEFIQTNLQYPEVAKAGRIEGRVIVRFIISKQGKVVNPEILKGISPELDQEALRIVGILPDFIPGKQDGSSVNVYYNLAVNFSFSGSALKSERREIPQ